ncbi:MAG: Calx-beta domain-containing protein [Actinomycetota bacterium]
MIAPLSGLVGTASAAPVPCTSVCYVDAVAGSDAFGGTSVADAKKTIQAALDTVNALGTVRVLPGTYNETATGRTPLNIPGTYDFGLFFDSAKAGITLLGVSAGDVAITTPAATLATINTNATNNFGPDAIYVDAANTTIQGVKIGGNTSGNNKTVSVAGDNFTLQDSTTDVPDGGGSIYINDTSATGTVVKSYHVLGNIFPDGTSVDISSGAGSSTPLGFTNRQILNNDFDMVGQDFPPVSFNGSDTGVPWFVNTVGGAVIKGNDFQGGNLQYIRARGTYPNAEFNWKSFWTDNTYDKAAVALVTESPFDVREFSYPNSFGTFNHVRRIGATIQGEVDNTLSGDTVLVKPGTYPEHVTLGHALTLKGANAGTAGNAARGPESTITGDSTGAVQLTGNDVTINGFKVQSASNALGAGIHMAATQTGASIKINLVTGNQIGIYANSAGASTISYNLFDANNELGSSAGSGIYSEFTDHMTISHNEFKNHTTNNPIIFGATAADVHTSLTVSNNSIHDNYSGIYSVGINGGAFTANNISAPGATALSFSGADIAVQVRLNKLHDSARGVRIDDGGFGLGDNSAITVNRNAITGNTDFGIGNLSGFTGPVDGTCNWWGAASGPLLTDTSGSVTTAPWLTSASLNGTCSLPAPRISIHDTGITEPNSGSALAHFRVTLSKASTKTITVHFTTADGSAAAPSDYAFKSGTITFQPGQTSKTINIAVKGDRTVEPNETFFVNLLSATNASIADANGSCVIRNND